MKCRSCEREREKLSEHGDCLDCLRAAAQGCTELSCMYHGPINAQIVDTFGREARYSS